MLIPKDIAMLIAEITVIEIPSISPKIKIETFKSIVKYLEYHYEISKVSQFKIPLKHTNNLHDIVHDEFDVNLVDKCKISEMHQLLKAANYLNIMPLFQLICVKLAISNRDKSKHQLYELYGRDVATYIITISPDDWWL